MSFHGGLLGVTFPMVLFTYRRKHAWLHVRDFVAPMVPPGLAGKRLGNFINGELRGRVTDPHAPWAMLFPSSMNEDAARLIAHLRQAAPHGLREIFLPYHAQPRHRSQLHEITFEALCYPS